MRFRTLVLAVALGCAVVAVPDANAKSKKVSIKHNKGYKTNRANRVKPRMAKARKVKPVKHRPAGH
jgi:hypothetical protein